MADSPLDASGESRTNILGPGIIGLLIQGIQTGVVISQLATWLSFPRRTEHRFITVVTVFLTTVGLAQTAISFFSSWRIYVELNGEPVSEVVTLIVTPIWTEKIQLFLTVLTSTPVQSLLLGRCYYILKRNLYYIVPLMLLLLGSVALAIFDTIGLFWGMFSGPNPSGSHAFWCFLLYSSLCSILDVVLSSILFYYLIQSRKRVYSDHAVQWTSRLIIILWQSAIPPTLCVVGVFLIYIASRHLHPGEMQMWFPMVQAIIGKLYVLSHFYNINARPLFGGEQPPTTFVFTLTEPAVHGTSASALNAPEDLQSVSFTNSFGRTDSGQP